MLCGVRCQFCDAGMQRERGGTGREGNRAADRGDEDAARGAQRCGFMGQGHDSPFKSAGVCIEVEDSEGVEGDPRPAGEHGGDT